MPAFSSLAQLLSQSFPGLTQGQLLQVAAELNTTLVSGTNQTYAEVFRQLMSDSAHVGGAQNLYFSGAEGAQIAAGAVRNVVGIGVAQAPRI